MSDGPTHPEQTAQGQTSQAVPSSPSPTPDASASPSGANKGSSIIKWPVPHVMVFFRDTKLAYGREGIAQLGHEFKMALFTTFLWKETFSRTRKNLEFAYEQSKFAKTATLFGVFHAVHGKDDVGPVLLGHIGWAGMVQNLVSITVTYEEEDASSLGWS